MSLTNFLGKKLVSCAPNTSVKQVAKLMKDEDVGCVVVLQDGKLSGIVTDRDLAVRCLADSFDGNSPVQKVMTKPVLTASVDDGIHDVVEKMKKNEIRRIPVVDKSGKTIGVLSFGDVFGLLSQEFSDLSQTASPSSPKLYKKAA